ncbi:MAG: hypothetical protein H0V67_01260 [Geodermatophilaceae bacterium]|nr:hypothetical protein [Geodermatophilaceae bacterium]
MRDERQNNGWINQQLADEFAETLSTLARLGVTVAGLPMAMLPREQRLRAKQLTGEFLRFGAAIPRAMGAMLDDVADEWQGGSREDLGSRLRRQRRAALKGVRRGARGLASSDPQAEPEAEPVEDPEGADEEVEEDIQEAWETNPENGK